MNTIDERVKRLRTLHPSMNDALAIIEELQRENKWLADNHDNDARRLLDKMVGLQAALAVAEGSFRAITDREVLVDACDAVAVGIAEQALEKIAKLKGS